MENLHENKVFFERFTLIQRYNLQTVISGRMLICMRGGASSQDLLQRGRHFEKTKLFD